MKHTFVRLFISLLFIIFLVLPVSVSGSTVPDISQFDTTFPEQIQPIDTSPATAPAVIVSDASIRSTSAVTVDEENPSANLNGGYYAAQLRVGSTSEFGYTMWSLISFSPLKQSEGGPIPDGAVIRGAKLRLYKESDGAGTIKVYRLSDGFNENTVTWDTQPGKWATAEGTKSVPSATGWVEIDIAEAMIINALNFNRPVRMVVCPTWEGSPSLAFKSDEHSSRGPILVVSYEGEPPPPEPTPPEPPAGDTTSCTIEYTVSPSHPRVGERVTVTVTARDDQAMDYLAMMRGYEELGRITASTPGDRELRIEYSEAARLPSLNYVVIADDLGDAPAVSQMINIPVIGSGTPPEVSITADWDIETVIPERYRLIRGDGQTVTLTATANDPDGIRRLTISINGVAHDYTYDGNTSVSQTFHWVNDSPGLTHFSYFAAAQDEEGSYVSTDAVRHEIVQPNGLLMFSTSAIGFHNEGTGRLSWDRFVQTFGYNECYYAPKWASWYALIWYHAGFKDIADGGQCFGMSTMANELYQSRIIANDIQSTATGAAYLTRDATFTKQYIEARQGGQIGEEVLFPRIHFAFESTSEKLAELEADLERNVPGVISIKEGDKGHAVVPWMTRHMPDGTVRIYIYDCNRVEMDEDDLRGLVPIIMRERDTGYPSYDFNDRWQLPYIEITGGSWSYVWNSTSTWNDEWGYFTYQEACGDMDQFNSLGENRFAPTITDHDIPSITDFLFCPMAGSADVYIEDEEGNVTGIQNGQIKEEIPGSMAVRPLMDGPFTDHELYVLPKDKHLKINVVGQEEGEYTLGLLGNGTVFGVDKKNIKIGKTDEISIVPDDNTIGHKYRMRFGTGDNDFLLALASMFEGRTEATDSDFIEREGVMEECSADEGCDFSVAMEEGGDTLIIDNYGEEDIEFDLSMRSTESLDEVESVDDLDYVPGSTEDDITLGGGRRLEATPDDWATTDEHGSLHTLKKKAEGGGGNVIPFIPIVIGVVVVVAIGAGIVLMKKGAFGKA